MDHLANTRGERVKQGMLLIYIATAFVLIVLTWLENVHVPEPAVPSYYRSVATAVAVPARTEAPPTPATHDGGGRRQTESVPATPTGIVPAASESPDAMIDE